MKSRKADLFLRHLVWRSLVVCFCIAGVCLEQAYAQLPSVYQNSSSSDVIALLDAGEADSALVLSEVLLEFSDSSKTKEHALNHYARGIALLPLFDFETATSHFIMASDLMQGEIDSLKYQANVEAANCLSFSGENELALEYLEQNLREEEHVPLRTLAATYYYKAGVINQQAEDELTLECYLKALEIMEELKDESFVATLKSYVGVQFFHLDNDSLALQYQQEALDYFNEQNDHASALYVLLERGSIYSQLGRFEEAEQDVLLTLEYAKEVEDIATLANGYNLMGRVCYGMERYQESLDYNLLSLELCREYEIPIGIASCFDDIIDDYIALGDLRLAEVYALDLNELADVHEFADYQRNGKEKLARIYELKGDFEGAYFMELKADAIRDSLVTEERTTTIAKLREEFEREKHLLELQDLQNEANLNEFKRNALIISFLVVFVLLLVIINREVKRRKKAKKLLQTEKQLAEIQRLMMQDKLDFKNRELTSNALLMARKNEFIQNLLQRLEELKETGEFGRKVQSLRNELKVERQMENGWDQFTLQFNATNPNFYKNISKDCNEMSKGDMRMAALIRMNMSTKDVANILSISEDGVKKARYRLRKKLDLQTDESLETHILKY